MAILGMLAFYIGGRPMADHANNFIQIFNEIVVCLCLISLVIFTDFIPDPVDRYDCGYYLLYSVAGTMGVNVLILIFMIVWGIFTGVRKFCRKKKFEKAMKVVQEKQKLRTE